jgi:hypothetical protein
MDRQPAWRPLSDRLTARSQLPDEADWLFDASRDYLTQLTYYKDRHHGVCLGT